MRKEAIVVELNVLSRNLSEGSEKDHEKNDIRCRRRIGGGPARIRARGVRLEIPFLVCQ